MFTIKIADLLISINNKFSFVESVCKDYVVDSNTCDFTVTTTEKELQAEHMNSGSNFSDGYIESVCIYRNIANKLPEYNAFVMHCAAVEYEGSAYCFAAKSGVGKTTHISLWRKYIGKEVNVINGDKPILRYFNNNIFVCGTPWSGKENLNRNVTVPLSGVCFLQQSSENSIARLSSYEALGKILKQVYLPKNSDSATKTVDLVGNFLSMIPMWELKCNISEEAAILSYKTMCGKE